MATCCVFTGNCHEHCENKLKRPLTKHQETRTGDRGILLLRLLDQHVQRAMRTQHLRANYVAVVNGWCWLVLHGAGWCAAWCWMVLHGVLHGVLDGALRLQGPVEGSLTAARSYSTRAPSTAHPVHWGNPAKICAMNTDMAIK